MQFISAEQIEDLFDYHAFIPFLKEFLTLEVTAPDRSHFDIPVPHSTDATLLTMPAWATGKYFGVKVVSVFPENKALPTINGCYLLMDGTNGRVLCAFDGLALTIKRTAAVSGLASQFLAPSNAKSMLMIGTGNLCHELIRAHASVHALEQVWVWGRNLEKAISKATTIKLPGVSIAAIANKENQMGSADIISSATLSCDPLILGDRLKQGFYLDLVGSYLPHCREADDACISRADAVVVDVQKALKESGDIKIPLEQGILEDGKIKTDLVSLCKGAETGSFGRNRLFKSVGFAGPDLATAVWLWEGIGKLG